MKIAISLNSDAVLKSYLHKYTKIVIILVLVFIQRLLMVDVSIASIVSKKAAFIIGISQYSHVDIPDLKYADSDAIELSKVLTIHGDYSKVIILKNQDATMKSISKGFQTLANWSKKQTISQILLYYSGHGVSAGVKNNSFFFKKGVSSREFLVPFDANLDESYKLADGSESNDTFIKREWLAKKISELQANTVFFVIDSCYSGVSDFQSLISINVGKNSKFFTQDSYENPKSIMVIEKKHDYSLNKNFILMSASSDNNISMEFDELKHGALSYALLKSLTPHNLMIEPGFTNIVRIDQLFNNVNKIFSTTYIDGQKLSSYHMPKLFVTPSYANLKNLSLVSIRGKEPEKNIKKGYLIAKSNIDAVRISIDGQTVSNKSPVTLPLEEGKYIVSFQPHGSNYRHVAEANIKNGQTSTLSVNLRGDLSIQSIEKKSGKIGPKLNIWINDVHTGEHSFFNKRDLLAGTNKVTVSYMGLIKTKNIEIRPNSPLTLRYLISIDKSKAKSIKKRLTDDVLF